MTARGGWGMAVVDSLNPGFTNVASLADIKHVVIKFSAYGENGDNNTDQGSRTTNRTLIPDIRAAIPVIPDKLAFSAGFQVGRSFEFRTMTLNTWYAFDDTVTGNTQFIREGTLWQIPLGVSWKVRDGISLGGTVGLVNGTIRESLSDFFLYPATSAGTALYLSNGREDEDEFSGKSTTWSVRLGSEKNFSLGASWTPAYDLDVDRKISMGGLAAREYSAWTMGMPEAFRAGFQSRFSGRWRFGMDGAMQKFGDFKGNDSWAADMVDEYSVGLGLEREIAFERHGGKNNLPLRVGVQYKRWGYQIGGSDVEEKTISLGTGFPFRSKMGMLDVALSYSMIGDMAKNGMESKIWRMSVSVTGLEKWW